MATHGRKAQILIASGSGVTFTNEAFSTSDLTTYTISNSAKRYWDDTASFTVQTSPDGVTWTTVTVGFSLQYVGGKVIFGSAQASGTQVRVSGKYKVYVAVINATAWGYDVEREEKESTVMTTTTTPALWKTWQMGLLGGTFKMSDWLADNTYQSLLSQDISMIASMIFDASTGIPRLECKGYLNKDSMTAALNDLEKEELQFRISGPVYIVTS